jgi:transposase
VPKSTTIIAFDQHAATTVAAVLLPGHRTPALHTLTSDSPAILRFVERLSRTGPVHCCYEAGPCGFELQRALTTHGLACDVIAPSLIPRRAGDRIKTDRRDAGQLAILYRAGALTAIHIPTEQEEAARDLLRCREDIRVDLLRARHRLSKFLLRHGRRFTATKKAWTKRHAAWLQAQRWPLPALEQTHRAYVRAVDEAIGRLRAIETELRDLLTIEPLRSRVIRLRCFRGIDDLTALTIAAELGDARRFPSAPRVMAFTGWCRPNTRAAPNKPAARSPKPAMPTFGACSSNRLGITGITRFSVGHCGYASAAHRPPSSTRPGTRSIACTVATAASPRAANPSNTS